MALLSGFSPQINPENKGRSLNGTRSNYGPPPSGLALIPMRVYSLMPDYLEKR